MNKLLRSVLQIFARFFKGSDYIIDNKLPLTALFSITLQRSFGLIRCLIKGVAYRPSKMVFIGPNVQLKNSKQLVLGKGVTLGKDVKIDSLSNDGVKILDRVNIGAYTIIEASGSMKDLGKGIVIGKNSGIGAFSFIGGAGGVDIGSDVIMGQYISFHPENHIYQDTKIPIRLQGTTRKGIVIGDDCWVGSKVTFLDGAHVGKGSVIAAGSVVRGSIPSYSIIAGIPAKMIKKRD